VWLITIVYDLSGKKVLVLADQTLAASEYDVTWDDRDASGRAVPSGTYVVRLEIESSVEARKVMLLW